MTIETSNKNKTLRKSLRVAAIIFLVAVLAVIALLVACVFVVGVLHHPIDFLFELPAYTVQGYLTYYDCGLILNLHIYKIDTYLQENIFFDLCQWTTYRAGQ